MFDQLHLNLDSHALYACVVGIACEVQCLPSEACSIAGCVVVESLLFECVQVSVSPESRYYKVARKVKCKNGDTQSGRAICIGSKGWVSYTECLQEYLADNDIDAATKQQAILLSSSGAETYQLIHHFVVPHKPVDKSLKQLVDLIQAH